MTLIEITVVILVLLTLISVLFIGANIYKRGADRAACILNIRNIHQAVRANQNLSAHNVGSPLVRVDIIGAGRYLETEPLCPTSSQIAAAVDETAPGAGDGIAAVTEDYPFVANTYPAVSTIAVICEQYGPGSGGDVKDHVPNTSDGW